MSTKCKLHSKYVHACSISSQPAFSTRAPPGQNVPPRCASFLNAGVDMRQRGCAVLSPRAPDVSVSPNSKQTRPTHDVMWPRLLRVARVRVRVASLFSTCSLSPVLWLLHLGSWTMIPGSIEKYPATPSYRSGWVYICPLRNVSCFHTTAKS